MSGPEANTYEFGEFRLDAGKRLLLRNGDAVALTPKAFETLLFLIQHRQRTVDKDELMQAIWPDTVVEENNLNQNISALRRVLGESRGENRYIATIPGKGYQFIADVQAGPAKSDATASRVTLAVLPFENLSADAEREYLSDGLTEETIAALGQIDPQRLRVIGRTSVMRYKRTTKASAEIGKELDASYLVEGSLRGEGERLRITAKLVQVSDQVQIWSASYDSEPKSMLAFQRELSTVIAEQIRLRLSPERLTALARRQTQNAEAYDLYLRGTHFWHQFNAAATKRAMEFFSRAVAIDPKYALAWCGLADSYAASPVNADQPPVRVGPLAREAATNAVAAEPGLAEAQTSLGFVKFWIDWDWPAAEAAYRKAIELDPGYPMAHRMLGILLAHESRHDEAEPVARRARELDPLVAVHHALSAQVAFVAGKLEMAKELARQAIVVDPEFWIGHYQLAQACEGLGQIESALEALNSAGRFSGGNSKVLALRGYIFARRGQTKDARAVLNTLEAIARERYMPPYAFALVHNGLGERQLALDWLEKAFAARDIHLAWLPVEPKWNPFRSEKRFRELLEHCGFQTPGARGQ